MQSIPEYQQIYLQNMTRKTPLRVRGAMGGPTPYAGAPLGRLYLAPQRASLFSGINIPMGGGYTLERLAGGVGYPPYHFPMHVPPPDGPTPNLLVSFTSKFTNNLII